VLVLSCNGACFPGLRQRVSGGSVKEKAIMRTATLLGGLALVGATALSNVGCVAHGHAGAYVEAEAPVVEVEAPVVFVEPPTLIEVDSDVWVVRDYDYPVYYVGDAYWVYRDDVWYRSDTYDGGWARIDVNIVPSVVVHRDHSAYVHYRGAATARTRVGPRGSEMRPASLDRRPGYVSEPSRGPPERAVEPRRGGPPERAVEPRRGPSGHAVEPPRGQAERGADQGRQGNDRGQNKANTKNKHR
jgi:hypothetical protein